MTAAVLVKRLTAVGCSLAVDGDAVKVRGPREALTPEVLGELRQRKGELVAALGKTATATRATLARRFVQVEALVPREAVEDPALWAVWRRFDRRLAEALKSGDLASAELVVGEAACWARERRAEQGGAA